MQDKKTLITTLHVRPHMLITGYAKLNYHSK